MVRGVHTKDLRFCLLAMVLLKIYDSISTIDLKDIDCLISIEGIYVEYIHPSHIQFILDILYTLCAYLLDLVGSQNSHGPSGKCKAKRAVSSQGLRDRRD